MWTNRRWLRALVALCAVVSACSGPPASVDPSAAPDRIAVTKAASSGDDYTFGMVLTGPVDDDSWNQSHFEGARYAVEHSPGTRFIYVDVLNPTDRPEATLEQAAEELIDQGAKFVITNSAEFADATDTVARAHPDVYFVHTSGDNVLAGKSPPNVVNLMGRTEYAKMLAGCAAALRTATGKIAYLGPLINDETRRMVNSTYLGARYCMQNYRNQSADAVALSVTWIGFWVSIPGVTLDAATVAADMIAQGNDVIVSGIDSPEPIVAAETASAAGTPVWTVAHDTERACLDATVACLGVNYLNWGPEYLRLITAARAGELRQSFDWIAPDWDHLTGPDGGLVGFRNGPALSPLHAAQLHAFTDELAGGLALFTGPLDYRDGTPFLAPGATPTDEQLWHTEQLLARITGKSAQG
ncbi:BMP family ABC transporter substrate-binding protein [Mycobacterium sp. CVI_P3]|uniref:BMP family ABC transporter substrate-binding protein n=1 Tax=Mycobacterium pinniadriaticum TaxID=2994102 RepID=A0ABT3SKZ1_9MYCO|nr:BMP family ABC transporter substrate-binding protein [Mycobacterium pinniadriaticum]MCX2933150.1 BMP family ABC transporter substrate-binding protein [Mycobacterium pinniadriaticum]MCX2939550.1 BMP family ABC transporter substrate-binding protein [Mycobacterium pinniadriaticum]